MRKKIFYFLCLTGLATVNPWSFCCGQLLPASESPEANGKVQAASATTQDNEVMPISPKAVSLLRFGEYPVSLYTGLVDITIPIYTIERCGISIPIEFKYHASGLRYDDVAMELGLGWTLNAGGVITQNIKGRRDGMSSSFTRSLNHVTPSYDTQVPDYYNEIRAIARGILNPIDPNSGISYMDGEMDIYSYSFLNQGGSFCFPFSESHSSGISAPSTGLFIPVCGMQAIRGQGTITLLDTEGVSYTFKILQGSEKNYVEYYLTEIEAANKTDKVTFSYDLLTFGVKRPYINSTYTIKSIKNIFSNDRHNTDVSDFRRDNGDLFDHDINPPRLRQIDFRGGHVAFGYKDNDSWRLDTIAVYNNLSGKPLQTIVIAQGKFGNAQNRLDKVTFYESRGQSYNYQFEYNGEPLKLGKGWAGVDYWGFFNVSPAPTPSRYFPDIVVPANDPQGIKGANRNPSESAMINGMLNKIIYPTKGYTTFTYQAHEGRNMYNASTTKATYGGLRIQKINNYHANNTLAGSKWYKYGENEDGAGDSWGYPEAEDFLTTSMVLKTFYHQLETDNGPCQVISYSRYSSFPRRNFLISGSPVVYPQVTEYSGNGTETLGKTMYKYEIFKDEQMYPAGPSYRRYSVDVSKISNAWKSGKLSSKQVYKKEGDNYVLVSSLNNRYQDISTSTYRNLRATQYVSFDSESGTSVYNKDMVEIFYHKDCYTYREKYYDPNTNSTPYNYFNYYTTTGLRVLTESVETTDGVSQNTTYTYNEYGFPTSVAETSSEGNNIVTENKYPGDVAGHTEMTNRNIISPLIEQREYVNTNLSLFSKTTYTNTNSPNTSLYAPWKLQSQTYGASSAPERIAEYLKYDRYGNPLYMVKENGLKVVYLWSYNSLYPVLQIENATYDQVERLLTPVAIASLANENPTDASLEAMAGKLRTGLPYSMVTMHTYIPMIGVSSITDPSGRKTVYEYDGFGRLLRIMDENGNPLQSYKYDYSNKTN